MVSRRIKWSVTLAAGLGALLALELGVRVALDPPVFIGRLPFDPDLGYTMPRSIELLNFDERGSFVYRLNAQGFRGPELPPEGAPKPPGEQRILFLGDSFQNAWAVREEELMSTVCEDVLREQGVAAEAYVFSCDDYGTAQELLLLERYGARVRPDAIVLSFHPANDVANNALELAGSVETSAGDYLRPYLVSDGEGGLERTWAQPARAFLRAHLRTFALLDRALIARARSGGLDWYAPWPLTHAWLGERLAQGKTPAEWHEVFRAHASDHPWERAWQATGALLRAVGEHARALDARLLVLVVPGGQQVEISAETYRQIVEIETHGGGALLSTYDLNLPERRVAELCAAAGVDVRFLVEVLREAVRETQRSHYVRDGHLNGPAHALAGAVVADWFAGGARFPNARPDAELTRSVNLLPAPADAPRWLDLADGAPNAAMADGWAPCFPHGDRERPAWAALARAHVLLPVRAGERVVVEGWLPEEAEVPTTLSLEVQGLQSVEQVLETREPFQVTLELSAPAIPDRLIPVSIAFSRTYSLAGDVRRFGAIISAIGLR